MSDMPALPLARYPLSALCAIALLFVATPSTAADTCTAPSADAAAATSQRLLQALIDTNGVPGMGAAVWRKGHVVWTGCSGLRDVQARKPVQRDTVFRLASVSKIIAATAAAKLAEEGRLDVDAPVGGLLPWLPATWSRVTVRQLVSHTSGAPHYAGNDLDTLGHVRYRTARDAVGIFSGRALLSTPGTSYSYSSWGYTLLGAVIEASSGEHFVDYVRQHVTHGLAIEADGDASVERASLLYDIDHGAPRRRPRTDMSYTWPGGGLAATPEALAMFGGRVLEHHIVSAARWQAMQQPTLLASGEPARERDYDVGFGWRLGRDADGHRIAHHAGITTGARSMLMLWPGQDTAVSLLSNALWVSSMEVTASMLAAPFRPEPDNLIVTGCPTSGRMAGTLKGTRFDLDATFRLERGRCIGELAAPAPLQEYFAKASAWPGRTLRVVALASDGTLSRAAFATPFGLYELRAIAAGRWSATLAAGATLELAMPTESAPRANGEGDEGAILALVDQFMHAIANKDKKAFVDLFLHNGVTWQSAMSDERHALEKRANPAAEKAPYEPAKTPAAFMDGIARSPARIEEKIDDVLVDTDSSVASVAFNFRFLRNESVINTGREYWLLVKTEAGWKIAAVVWSRTTPPHQTGAQ